MNGQQPLTGTEDHPIERIPQGPSSLPEWAALLAGPVIWMAHFGIVYLAAEASCVPAPGDQYEIIGSDGLVVLTLVATVVGAVATAAVAWKVRRRLRREQPDDEHDVGRLSLAGLVTAIGSLVGIIAVGAPALYLDPVC